MGWKFIPEKKITDTILIMKKYVVWGVACASAVGRIKG